ncbi:MAG: type ISP restriction/modification enzyme, partial [Desulfococcaceae bacterium]|nr:type ISP restriction/modification enzyme [Desulfococcaceae bacterium]
QIHEKFAGQQGIWSNYVEEHLIPRLNGFEILMASYTMAHLKLGLLLEETGFKPKKQERFRIFLTNSLEEADEDTGTLFTRWLSREASEANLIKRDTPVMCVIGNPPYSGHSANKSIWLDSLLKDYKQEPGGGKLNEKNPKWLNDDYVKFIRYGQYFIEKNGEGILAFVNNHSFLDNPTFRGMRWHLLTVFDKIYIIDLHGNSKKKEVCPDGTKDENVFDIQQGVSINLFVKTGKKKKNQLGEIFHCDLYGDRDKKYSFLWDHNIRNVGFTKLPNVKPLYFFLPKDFETEKIYKKGFLLTELYQKNSVGIVTARDNFTIHQTPQQVENIINDFINIEDEEARQKYNLGKDVRDWKIRLAKNDLIQSGLQNSNIVSISYRPFDKRFTYYTGKSKGFHCMPRAEIMQHFIRGSNLGLIFKRGFTEDGAQPLFVSKYIIDFRSWSRPGMQGGDFIVPLYLYPEENSQKTLDDNNKRTPNLNPGIIKKISESIHLTFTPEKEETKGTFAPIDILDYIYAVLHSPTYRETYKEFLKIDFPRVPYPKDQKIFWQMVTLGGELRTVHLLENPVVEQYITTYPKDGDNSVTRKITKKDFEITDKKSKTGRVWINDEQYFDSIPQTAWEFYIGGYRPAQKWLKDRKGRQLNFEDILHYQKIIVALNQTDILMKKIDRIK